jgi:RNA polymerase primary sigma factor
MRNTPKPSASKAPQSPLESYLREINETPLLSADQEKHLANRVKQGDLEARNQMVRANLRLVVNIAREFTGKGLPLEDLIEEGNLGLLRAVEAFDPDMNTRFSTYASYWIKQSIQRTILKMSKTVRVPAYAANLVRKWQRMVSKLHDELKRMPTEEEVARRMGLPERKVEVVRKALHSYSVEVQMEEEESSRSFEEKIEDVRTLRPDEEMLANDSRRELMIQLQRLDAREAKVLRMRFGLNDHQPCTHKEIGDSLGLTRQRVRQIETRALAKLAQGMAAHN